MIHLSPDGNPKDEEFPELPAFLKRDANNESEWTKMVTVPVKTYAPETEGAPAGAVPSKAKTPAKAKANGVADKPAKADRKSVV